MYEYDEKALKYMFGPYSEIVGKSEEGGKLHRAVCKVFTDVSDEYYDDVYNAVSVLIDRNSDLFDNTEAIEEALITDIKCEQESACKNKNRITYKKVANIISKSIKKFKRDDEEFYVFSPEEQEHYMNILMKNNKIAIMIALIILYLHDETENWILNHVNIIKGIKRRGQTSDNISREWIKEKIASEIRSGMVFYMYDVSK